MHSRGVCRSQVPFISAEALHDVHIFVFVIGASHIITCAAAIMLANVQVRKQLPHQVGLTPNHLPVFCSSMLRLLCIVVYCR